MPPNPASTLAADRHAQRFAQLRQQLQELGYFCKGTVLQRRMKCGQPRCACHRDPSQRHGPYWEWTYKVRGKTVNVRLSSEAGPIYQAASRQYRKLKSLLTRLERVARAGLAAQAKKAKPAPRSEPDAPCTTPYFGRTQKVCGITHECVRYKKPHDSRS